ncbi:MAG: hypothetical protein MZU91_14600, partial [Desulfosudis oleivorans]|nr:hypothetical protein [Desulfosudis oleivorans]
YFVQLRIAKVKQRLQTESTAPTNLIERASFNFYCPSCNKDPSRQALSRDLCSQWQQQRVNFPSTTMMEMIDLDRDLWKCPLCETVTDTPFPKHKMEDELFTPVYDKLYEEHFVDRLKIYNNINDQKRTYFEKQGNLASLQETQNKGR